MSATKLSKIVDYYPPESSFPIHFLQQLMYPLFGLLAFSWLLAIPFSIWVYIDARRRTEHAFLYALLTFLFWPIGIVAYLISRKGIPEGSESISQTTHPSSKTMYLFTASFILLNLSFLALVDLVNNLVQYMSLSTETFYAAQNTLRKISFRLSSFLVLFPVYFIHWKEALKNMEKEKCESCLKQYTSVILVIYLIVFILASVRFLFHFNNMLFGIEDFQLSTIFPSLFTAVASAGVLFCHKRLAKSQITFGI